MASLTETNVHDFPRLVAGTRAPLFWAMIFLVAIETMVFATLISTYFYLRMGEPQRPPAGMDPPKLLLPTVNTLVLPASSVAVYWADSGVKEGNQRALRVWMLAAVGLSVLFLLLKVVEYGNVEYGPADHAYGSIVWTIVGFHSAHVLSVTLKAIVVDLLAWWGFFNQQRRIGVQVNGIYWHFVVAVWIPLYAVLYFAPRVL
jgi:heme/copper-type cytochrome/quinol oxidase subunit 3